jgi:hypothetical protein
MPAQIVFSLKPEASIYVDEDFIEANDKLSQGSRTASGLCEMKEWLGGEDEAVPIFVNPDHVVCIKPVAA